MCVLRGRLTAGQHFNPLLRNVAWSSVRLWRQCALGESCSSPSMRGQGPSSRTERPDHFLLEYAARVADYNEVGKMKAR